MVIGVALGSVLESRKLLKLTSETDDPCQARSFGKEMGIFKLQASLAAADISADCKHEAAATATNSRHR